MAELFGAYGSFMHLRRSSILTAFWHSEEGRVADLRAYFSKRAMNIELENNGPVKADDLLSYIRLKKSS